MRPGPAVEDCGTQRLGEATDVFESQPLSPGDPRVLRRERARHVPSFRGV